MRPRTNDWAAIAAFALLVAVNQMLWLTFAPVTTDTAEYLGVSEGSVGLLAEVFPLIYVLLAIPAGLMLDRWMREVLVAAAVLNAAGALLRLGGDAFAWLLAGQLMIAIAQPAILGAITKIADERLMPEDRPRGIAISSAFASVGALAALALGALIGAEAGPAALLWIGAAVAVVAALFLVVALGRPAPQPATTVIAPAISELRSVWGDSLIRRLSAIAFLGFGIYVALTTWLQVLLEPRGVSSEQAGWLLVGLTLAGVVGALVVPAFAVPRGRETATLGAIAAIAAGCCLTLALVQTAAAAALPIVICGFFLIGALPLLLGLADRRAGAAAASAVAAIWLAGNAGGITVALILQLLIDEPAAAFVVAASIVGLAVPLARGTLMREAVVPLD